MPVTIDDVALVGEAGGAADVKALALRAIREGDKPLALFLYRCVKGDNVLRDAISEWAVEATLAQAAAYGRWVAEMDALARMAPVAPPVAELPVLDETPCGLCGEPADAEMGEFWDEKSQTSVIAHGTCGTDAGLALA